MKGSVMTPARQATVLCAVLALWSVLATSAPAAVTVQSTPDGGIQPQAIVDSKGTLHLLYFKGEAGGGDLFYVRRDPSTGRFSEPIRVNSQAGSAVATGTVRGGQLALGKGGRAHVVWNGSGKAEPRSQGKHTAPLLYARLRDDGTGFEAQRNLMRTTTTLDGGGTIAADQAGNVYAVWHATKLGSASGESERQVWLARSTDDGRTFAEETPVNTKPTGACGCCSSRAFADASGSLYVLYRTAQNGYRNMFLLSGKEPGKGFTGATVHEWKVGTCPMSTLSFAQGPGGVVATWDTDGQVYFTMIKPGTAEFGPPQGPPGAARGRKHPAVAVNAQGEMILVWTEGTGWQRGGSLAWQVFDKGGQPTGEKGRLAAGVPVWGLPTVVATDKGFAIFH